MSEADLNSAEVKLDAPIPQARRWALFPQLPAQVKEQLANEFAYQIAYLRVPLFVVALFLFCSKLISIWLLLICSFLAAQALYPHLPAATRERFQLKLKDWSFNHALEWKFLRELKDGVKLMKPFIFVALFFAAAPISVIVMGIHYVRKMFNQKTTAPVPSGQDAGTVLLKQNIVKQNDEETTFYHSPAFALTTLLVVVLGIPVAVIIFIYSSLGIEQVLNQTQSYQVKAKWIQPEELPVLQGHDKNLVGRRFVLNRAPLPYSKLQAGDPAQVDLKHFAIYAYIMSLGWCFAVLFMRAYFTFPMNFASTEYDIEVDREGVKKGSIKGWFAEFVWYFWPDFMPRNYTWSDIKRVDYVQGGFGRLSPLPATIFSKRSIVYQVLNKMASATDGLVDKLGRTEYVTFDINADETNAATRINIRLWELSSDDKARLFYAIRTYAPELYIPQIVQEKLIGSAVMKEARYTEIWFDLLTSNQDRKRQDSLFAGDTLAGGKYTVVDKLGAGGQAAAFLAKAENGDVVVLKEFILTSAETFGALVESATDFENESSTLSRLDHPRVVRFLDIFAEDRRAYIVLEYVPGTTLRQFVESSGPLPEEDVVELALQMCDILGYLHEQSPPVVHRDFTPENLIRESDGSKTSLKIVDFSVASRTGPAKSGDCVGKHSYTPPEQFRSQASSQSDIYALGATLFFLLTGSDPKPISTSDPRAIKRDVSKKLAAIIQKSTSLDLTERYESVNWLRLDLEELRALQGDRSDAVSNDAVLNVPSRAEKQDATAAVIEMPLTIKIPKRKKKVKSRAHQNKKRSARKRA
jgi:serine/threonine protein kinase